jgi:hypothetical protein
VITRTEHAADAAYKDQQGDDVNWQAFSVYLKWENPPLSFRLGVVLSGIGVLVWGMLLVGFVRQMVLSVKYTGVH